MIAFLSVYNYLVSFVGREQFEMGIRTSINPLSMYLETCFFAQAAKMNYFTLYISTNNDLVGMNFIFVALIGV